MTLPDHRPRIAVLGSINMDLVVRCQQLPVPGETRRAQALSEIPGGKGANQAVAAARAGAQVGMIGRVGDDAFGQSLRETLQNDLIDCQHVATTIGCSSGVAIVAVEDSGQNSIMVVAGANGQMTVDDVRAAETVICNSNVLLVQLETPLDCVLEGIRIAKQHGITTILDPAPAPESVPEGLLNVDVICPNESEAEAIAGMKIHTDADVRAAADQLHDRGAGNVIITLGERGAYVSTADESWFVDSWPIAAVDTTAAGDAFAGTLAVCCASKMPLPQAVKSACAAGALAASRRGAQTSMPGRADINALVNNGDKPDPS